MEIRTFSESDGKCFARKKERCSISGRYTDDFICGTYRCKWYKPEGCEDWVRLDTRNMARLFPPEEVSYGKDKQ